MSQSKRTLVVVFRLLIPVFLIASFLTQKPQPVLALPELTITPITWNVVGLDSNNVNVGPNLFPVGARVCNVGTTDATNVTSNFEWVTTDPYIKLRPQSIIDYSGDLALSSLAAGDCADFYYEIEIVRNSAAYEHTARYYITAAADGLGEITTPTPREIYIEHLISQNRNSTDMVYLNGVAKPAGSTLALEVGKTYTIRLEASTATQGYNQLESFISFPNTIFQILDVSTLYTANSSTYVANANDMLYADACLWDMNPDSLTYLSCIGSDGKAGGDITIDYTVKIIGGAGTSQSLNTLIYDFSGSSFHYNSDYSSSSRVATISTPLGVEKTFTPALLTSAGSSKLSLKITNSGGDDITGLTWTDDLPSTPAQMVVAGTPSATTSADCLPTTPFLPASNATTISYEGGVKAGGTCTLEVNVTVPSDGTYLNVTDHLLINGGDTGLSGSASLTLSTLDPGTTCNDYTLASWTMSSATADTHQSDVTTYSATPGANGTYKFLTPTTESSTIGGSGGSTWNAIGFQKNTFNPSTSAYFQFAIDTSKYTNIYMDFNVFRANNGPTDIRVYYGNSSDPATQTSILNQPGVISNAAWYSPTAINFTGLTNPTGVTYFTVYGYGAQNTGAGGDIYLDDVVFTGTKCQTIVDPTLTKEFLPASVDAGVATVLRFTLHNTNSSSLAGVSFTDVLPAGLRVTTNPAAPYNTSSTTCASATFAPLAGDTTVNFSGGTIPGAGSCTASVYVVGDIAGPYHNVSGYISSPSTGINTTDGWATADLTVNALPPVIEKIFSPNPALTTGTSTLTITITNPNKGMTLTGVRFTDTMPLGLTAGTPTTTCTDGDLSLSTANSISLTGATIPANGVCTVSVSVSGEAPGTYNNTTSNVSADTVGDGNTASDSLVLNNPVPGIALLKQVGVSPTGPWLKNVNVAPGDSVYYRLTIENTGDVPLSPVWVSDPDLNTSYCAWPAFLPVASVTTDPTAVCVVAAGAVKDVFTENTATASGKYDSATYTSAPDTASYSPTSLTLEKASTTPSFSALNDEILYTFTVTNTGAASLPGPVRVFDTNSTVVCDAVSTVGDFDPNFDKDEELVCTSSYRVTALDLAVGSVTNTAYATAGSATSNMDRTTVYEDDPDLVVSKTNNTVGGFATVDSPFNWTVRVTNIGPAAADFLNGERILTDTLPTASYGPLTVNVLGTPGNVVSCDVTGDPVKTLNCYAVGPVSIGSNQYFTVSLEATTNLYDALTNTAQVDPDNTIPEGNEGNNRGSDVVFINPPLPDLVLDKSNDKPGSITNLGTEHIWTILVTNQGGSTATFNDGDRLVTDVLPAGVNYYGLSFSDSFTSGDVTCSITGIVTKTLNCYASGAVSMEVEQVFTVSFSALTDTRGPLVNTAVADPDHTLAESDSSNNADQDTLTVRLPEITVTKENNTSDLGNQTVPFDWTLTVRNTGQVVAVFDQNETILRDVLPLGVTPPLTAAPSAASAVTGTIDCTIADEVIETVTYKVLTCNAKDGAVAIGPTTGRFSVVLTVTPTLSGTLSNTALVDPDNVIVETDETVDTNTSTDTLSITANEPSIQVVKSSTTTYITATGQVVPYTFTVTNNGSLDLTGVTISDPLCDGGLDPVLSSGDDGDSVLELTETWIYTCDHTVSLAEFTAGVDLSNTVTVDSAESESATSTLDLPVAALKVVKSADASVITAPNQDVLYTFTLTNEGSQALTNITVSDEKCDTFAAYVSGDGGTVGTLDTSETWVYECDHTVSQAEFESGVDLENTVLVDSDESGSATDTLTLPVAAINVVKSTSTTTILAVDQVIPYTFTVTNPGSAALTGVTVNDALCDDLPVYISGDTLNAGSLDTTETWVYTCDHTVSQAEIDAGSALENTVTVDSTESAPDTDSVSLPIAVIEVTKTSETASVTQAGQVVTYTFQVNATGSVPLTNISINDPDCDGLISGPSGDANLDSILQTSETWLYSCDRTVTQTEMNAGGNLSNTVRVDSDESQPATATLDIPIGQNPAVSVEKTSTTESIVTPGVVNYTLLVRNAGNVTLSGVTVSDPMCAANPAYQSGDTNVDTKLQIGEVWRYTCSHTVTQTEIDENTALQNTATADTTESPAATGVLSIPITKEPVLGVAKRVVGGPAKVEGEPGVWTITFEILARNYGNVPLLNLQLKDVLTTTFTDDPVRDPATAFSVVSVSSDDFSVNWPGYTGMNDATSNLLAGTDSLAVGADGTVTLVLKVTPASEGPFPNTVVGTANDAENTPVTDDSTTGVTPDPDSDGDPRNNSTPTDTTFSANLFDPPHGIKAYDDSGLPALLWTMEWINDTNIVAVDAEVSDPIAVGTTYLVFGASSGYDVPIDAPPGSTNVGVSCTDSSAITVTTACYYEGRTDPYPRGRIIWRGTLGPDFGETDPAEAVNDLTISFYVSVADGVSGVQNVASISSDLNGDQDYDDAGEVSSVAASRVWGTLPVNDPGSAPVSLVNPKLPDTGFAPNRVTLLDVQSLANAYASTGGVVLEIPALGLETEVLGVPLNAKTGSWDVSWLSGQVGWLNGTAFPSASGNSVLTAHVYLPTGKPGPFVDLGTLKWGQQIILHANGQRYVYEVREVKRVAPGNTLAFKHEEKAWLTLVTCQGYNEKTDTYTWRKLVRAVLVEVR